MDFNLCKSLTERADYLIHSFRHMRPDLINGNANGGRTRTKYGNDEIFAVQMFPTCFVISPQFNSDFML